MESLLVRSESLTQSTELLGSVQGPVDPFCVKIKMMKLIGSYESEETTAIIARV